jgi:hypothetical protein
MSFPESNARGTNGYLATYSGIIRADHLWAVCGELLEQFTVTECRNLTGGEMIIPFDADKTVTRTVTESNMPETREPLCGVRWAACRLEQYTTPDAPRGGLPGISRRTTSTRSSRRGQRSFVFS